MKLKMAFVICVCLGAMLLAACARGSPACVASLPEASALQVSAMQTAANTTDTTGNWTTAFEGLISNPLIIGTVMAIVYNVGLYIAACARSKKLEPYEKLKLLETLALFETLFFTLSFLGGLPVYWTSAIALILAFVRSLKTAISDFLAELAKTPAPPAG
jgi:hypothetical protein